MAIDAVTASYELRPQDWRDLERKLGGYWLKRFDFVPHLSAFRSYLYFNVNTYLVHEELYALNEILSEYIIKNQFRRMKLLNPVILSLLGVEDLLKHFVSTTHTKPGPINYFFSKKENPPSAFISFKFWSIDDAVDPGLSTVWVINFNIYCVRYGKPIHSDYEALKAIVSEKIKNVVNHKLNRLMQHLPILFSILISLNERNCHKYGYVAHDIAS